MADRLLILYSRAGCHLCGEMLEALRSLQGLEQQRSSSTWLRSPDFL
jgi:hypothetical protein